MHVHVWKFCILQGPLPLDPHVLGERAMECRAYAKALHYKEDEFHKGPTTEVIGALISINQMLQQKEAAAGENLFALICGAVTCLTKDFINCTYFLKISFRIAGLCNEKSEP